MGEKNDCLLKYRGQWEKNKKYELFGYITTYTFPTYLGPSESNGVNHSFVALSVVELQLI